MRPNGSVEGADSAGVRKCFRLIAGDGDQPVAWSASHVIYDRTRHSGVCLIINHPVCAVETHQPRASADPDSAARVRFDIEDPRTGQRRVACIIQRERAVVSGDEFPQTVFRADPEIVLRVHGHGMNIVDAIIVTAGAERQRGSSHCHSAKRHRNRRCLPTPSPLV